MNTPYLWIFIHFCAIKIILQLYNTAHTLIVIELYCHSIKQFTNTPCLTKNYKNKNKIPQWKINIHVIYS